MIPKFDDRFQRSFSQYLLRDTQLLQLVSPYLVPEYFSNEVFRSLVFAIREFYRKYHGAPDQMVFTFLTELHESKQLSDTMFSILTECCREMLGEPLQNREYLLGIYDKALQHIAFDGVLPKFMEAAKQGDFATAQIQLREALQNTPSGRWQEGRFFSIDPTDRITRRQSREADEFPTLIPKLDRSKAFICRGELGMIQGQRTSIGKSAMLVHLARSLIFQGKRVVIYTMEMDETAYEDRLDMCISGLTSEGLQDVNKLRDRLRRIVRDDRMLLVKQFPGYKTSVADLRDHCKQLREFHHFHPDCVIVDYDDLLDPGTRDARASLYFKGLEIYGALRAWCVEEHIGCWVACQSKSGATEKTTATESDAGGSKAKAETADVVLTLNRTADEEVRGITRIFVAKVRTQRARYEVTIPTDLSRMQFYNAAAEVTNG